MHNQFPVAMKLFEECEGRGELLLNGRSLCAVKYRIQRFNGVMEGSGLPIPGLHRIEGVVDLAAGQDGAAWVGVPLTLKMSDGRMLGVTLVDAGGRVLSEGHGPMKCMCC